MEILFRGPSLNDTWPKDASSRRAAEYAAIKKIAAKFFTPPLAQSLPPARAERQEEFTAGKYTA